MLFAQRYLNGKAPGWVYYIQQLATIVPILKGETPADGIRPISLFSTLSRAWKAQAAREWKHPIVDSDYLMPVQLGVATPGGGLTQATAVDLALETRGDEPGFGIAACDVKNAFSEMLRVAGPEAMLKCPIPGIRGFVKSALKQLSISSKAATAPGRSFRS